MKSGKFLIYGSFAVIVLLFAYFRLTIINTHNVAYTYDQGRDFLAGARIVVDKNPVFIGPTTGIGGLFHGAWWYYATAASFMIFGPAPINYYYFLFVIHLVSFIVWLVVVRKVFGDSLALISGVILSSGSYYVGNQTFAGNNILTIPSFALFCISLLIILSGGDSKKMCKSKTSLLLIPFLWGASTGFVAETELSFGLFLVPSIILLFATSKAIRSYLFHKLSFLSYAIGLLIPFLPRILFEVKNGFLQTKVLLGFFTKPKLYNPRSYSEVFDERVYVFRTYWEQALGSNFLAYLSAALLVGIVVYVIIHKYRLAKSKSETLPMPPMQNEFVRIAIVFATLLAGLFVFCLVYRDPFWGNYYEGIQLGFVVLFLALIKTVQQLSRKLYLFFITITILLSLLTLKDRLLFTMGFKAGTGGLKMQESIVQQIVDTQNKKGDKIFCARVYTPPVIPHTYDYLWFYHYQNKDIETPRYDYVDGKCWYIIEPEWKGYEFRLVEWKKKNIPAEAKEISSTKIEIEGVTLVQYTNL